MTWWQALVPLVSAILGAVIGGLVVHRLTLRRESLTARRTQRVAFLLDAYRKLIDVSERDHLSPERRDNLEGALADIMLLGGKKEIEASDRFQRDFAEGKAGSLTAVITSLRNSLRAELSLPEVDLPEQFNFRIHIKHEPGRFPEKPKPDQLLLGSVANKAHIIRKVNQAQVLRTGQELTGEREQQVLGSYRRDLSGRTHKVLWVDDNEDWIAYEREMLEAAGISITWVPNTSLALDLLDRSEFQTVITDMNRKEGPRAGYTLLDSMRRRGNETPLFVYSGSNHPDHLQEVLDHGGQGATNDPSRLFELVMNGITQ